MTGSILFDNILSGNDFHDRLLKEKLCRLIDMDIPGRFGGDDFIDENRVANPAGLIHELALGDMLVERRGQGLPVAKCDGFGRAYIAH